MEKLTEYNVFQLYSLMDSAYDTPQVRTYIEGKGRVALIDQNKRRKASYSAMDEAKPYTFRYYLLLKKALFISYFLHTQIQFLNLQYLLF